MIFVQDNRFSAVDYHLGETCGDQSMLRFINKQSDKSEALSALRRARLVLNYIRFVFSIALGWLMFSGAASAQIINIETFGNGPYPGPPLSGNQTTYTYNAPAQPANYPNILMDGDYVLATDSQQGFTAWSSIGDNTTGTGYMMLVNADDNQSGEFYRATVPLTANTSFDFLTNIVNVNSQGDFDFCTTNQGGLVLPDVTMQIEDLSGNIIATIDTGPIPFNPNPEWDEYSVTFSTDAQTSAVQVVLINNSVGGCGNDLAIDDITFRVAITIDAIDDTVTVANTDVTQPAVLVLGANDTIDGNPLPGTELYFTAIGSTLPSVLTLDENTGEVGVLAGTPEGTYTFEYEVCETSNRFNCDTATATVVVAFPPPEADLVTVKSLVSANPNPNEGDVVTFQIEVSNNGTSDATGVSLTDLLPAGLTATAANGTVSAGTYNATTGLWSLGDLADGDSETLTIEGTVDAGQSGNAITNTLVSTATGDQIDPTMIGDDLTETVTVAIPDPSLTMTKVADSEGPHQAGDVVTYTYTVTNDGNQVITDVVISDSHNGSDPAPTPGNETLLTDVAPFGDSTDAGTDNSWDALAPGDTVVFTGTYTVTAADVANL